MYVKSDVDMFDFVNFVDIVNDGWNEILREDIKPNVDIAVFMFSLYNTEYNQDRHNSRVSCRE